MAERTPWRCRILGWLGLHGRVWLRPDPTPNGYRSCYGCGRPYRPASSEERPGERS